VDDPVKYSVDDPVKYSVDDPVKYSVDDPVKYTVDDPVKYTVDEPVMHTKDKSVRYTKRHTKNEPKRYKKVASKRYSKVSHKKGGPKRYRRSYKEQASKRYRKASYKKQAPKQNRKASSYKKKAPKQYRKASYKKEAPKQYGKASYAMDVVLPDPIWLTSSRDSELVIRNCHVHGAKKCSSFGGGKALMDSIKDDTAYGYGTGHYGEHCCVKKVEQCETKYVSRCNRRKAKDLTQEQCVKVAKAQPLSFESVVANKHQFPGCYYRKADGKTFWNSFGARDGYGDGSHGDRRVYAPICTVKRCKVEHPNAYKKVEY